MEDQDSILDALDKIKDWAMKHMVKSGDAPQEESSESPEMEASEHEMPDGEMMSDDEMPIEEEEAPKNTVMKRYDFAGKPSAPKAPPSMPGKFKKRR